ncbi:ABC transporter transmembrane domain-containing protein [Dictyoglomus sp.]|uniref:ABC transporter transmembrane domain-containing protein n=1 Tax=Dictyoglomus sp. TaxID=28205 RepID=UPI003CC244B8
MGDIFYQPFVFTLGLILALRINWKLTLFTFAIIPLCIYLSVIITKPVEKYTN